MLIFKDVGLAFEKKGRVFRNVVQTSVSVWSVTSLDAEVLAQSFGSNSQLHAGSFCKFP